MRTVALSAACTGSQGHIVLWVPAYPRCVVCTSLKGVIIRAHSYNVPPVSKARDTACRRRDLLAYEHQVLNDGSECATIAGI
jgi:hypothetical protein